MNREFLNSVNFEKDVKLKRPVKKIRDHQPEDPARKAHGLFVKKVFRLISFLVMTALIVSAVIGGTILLWNAIIS